MTNIKGNLKINNEVVGMITILEGRLTPKKDGKQSRDLTFTITNCGDLRELSNKSFFINKEAVTVLASFDADVKRHKSARTITMENVYVTVTGNADDDNGAVVYAYETEEAYDEQKKLEQETIDNFLAFLQEDKANREAAK